MVEIFGTFGPSCDNLAVLSEMFKAGMTGIRINLSHITLSDCADGIEKIHQAAYDMRIEPDILIDLQGPELRIGSFDGALTLNDGDSVLLGREGIPVDEELVSHMKAGAEILLDDGKILLEVKSAQNDIAEALVRRGGILTQKKSILLEGEDIDLPALSEGDIENLKDAQEYGITAVMQPFVRSRDDLQTVRNALDGFGCSSLKLFAKIESRLGLDNIELIVPFCDEVIIARGDLGNVMPLSELPHAQKRISRICNENRKPFMVVTQMLASMENTAVPTRAEVSDIYNAVLDGASSLMLTGETAIGKYPIEAIKYLHDTAKCAVKHPGDGNVR